MNTSATAPSASTLAGKWNIDPAHTAAHFSVRHLMISNVRGEFTKVSGTAQFDPANLSKSSVEITIDATSLNTREPQRDDHLRSPDFLDVAKHPAITFRSTDLHEIDPQNFELTGDLTIHGVTKEVTLDVEGPTEIIKDPWGNTRVGFTGKVKINRKDFGLVWNAVTEAGGVVVGDEVKIDIEAELIHQPA